MQNHQLRDYDPIHIIPYNEDPTLLEYCTGWDFPVSELQYLLEEHANETFLLYKGRLRELSL